MELLNLLSYPPTARISTGLVAWCEGQLVWALGNEKYWSTKEGTLVIPVIGIGGGMEQGERLPEAVMREAREEAAVDIRIRPARSTLLLTDERLEVTDLVAQLPEEPAPLMVWQSKISLRDDRGNPYQRDYVNAVYEAELLGQPRPAGEIPGLLLMSVAALLQLLQAPLGLDALQKQGVNYIGRPLPDMTRFRLQGSALFVAKLWHQLTGLRS
ncbi:MAG: NUDIX domain-containing protein [Firmicutes bacterium]|nr:NUDIX domain-containing protein [Bacillota bacterium]